MNFKFLRSLEVRITLLVTLCSALILCSVGFMTYLGINQILLKQQDKALADRINRLEILLQDSENVEQIIARPKLGEFKHEVRQFEKSYDNQQAEQISLMV